MMAPRFENTTDTVLAYGAAALSAIAFAGAWGQGKVAEWTYSKEKAEDLIEIDGYKDIKFVDKDTVLVALRGCSEDDAVSYEFRAKEPSGNEVNLLVCKGLGQQATVDEVGYFRPIS